MAGLFFPSSSIYSMGFTLETSSFVCISSTNCATTTSRVFWKGFPKKRKFKLDRCHSFFQNLLEARTCRHFLNGNDNNDDNDSNNNDNSSNNNINNVDSSTRLVLTQQDERKPFLARPSFSPHPPSCQLPLHPLCPHQSLLAA